MADHSRQRDAYERRGRHVASQPAQKLQLTEEEKAVLLECRRNSIARGFPLGILTVLVLRGLVRRGDPSSRLRRWSWIYYTGGFMISFVLGAASYRHQCFEKIMALENSVLADQVRKHTHEKGFENWREQQSSRRPGQPTHYPPPKKQSDAILDDRPAVLYTDQPSPQERIDPLPPLPPPTDQPRMFQTPPSPEGGRPRVKKEGRTFDDIREENRKQQTQQAYPLRAQWMEKQQQQQQREEKDAIGIDQRPQATGRVPRRNKYGDIVYDD